jgi:hypothetical protein
MFHKHSPSKETQVKEEEKDTSASSISAPVEQDYVDIDEYDSSGKNPFF